MSRQLNFNPERDLHPKQRVAFSTIATEILYGGAAGGGKSALMRYLAVFCAFAMPGIQIYLFRRTGPDLEKNHVLTPDGLPAMLAPFLANDTVKWNQAKGIFSFPGGSRIFLCHCQYEKDKQNYQGAEIHLLLIDELTHFTESIYTYLRARCRLGGWKPPEQFRGLFPRILNGSNPGGIGHNWVKAMFVTYQPELGIRRTPKIEGGMLRQYIPAKLEDNPTLLENDPEYKNRLHGIGDPALVKAMLDGDWDIVAGGAFDDVWKKAVHLIRPFAIPGTWKVDRSFDWGSSAPFSVGWWAEANGEEITTLDGKKKNYPRGTLIRIAEWYGWSGKPNQGCKMLARDVAKEIKVRESKGILARLNVRPGPADNSIFDKENGVCISNDMAKEGIRWRKSNKNPGSRKNGLEVARTMLKAANPEQGPMESPGLLVFNTCTHFARTIPVLPRSDSDMDDIDTKAEDHIWDETRYRILQGKSGTKTQEM